MTLTVSTAQIRVLSAAGDTHQSGVLAGTCHGVSFRKSSQNLNLNTATINSLHLGEVSASNY